MSTTLTAKGQVTIPKNLRDHLGLRPGDQIDFEFLDDLSIRLRPVRKRTRKSTTDRYGPLVGIRGRGLDTDELMEMLRGYSEDKNDPGFL